MQKTIVLRHVLGAVISLGLITPCTASRNPCQSRVELAPEASFFSSERLRAIDAYYQGKVDRGEMAGIVLLIAHKGQIVHFNALGYADTGSRQKLQKESIFRLYSMTKPFASAALMMLYEEGKFQLTDPISKFIPEFTKIRVLRTPDSPITDTVAAKREPTIHDLLRFTDGFTSGLDRNSTTDQAYIRAGLRSYDISLKQISERLSKIPLAYQPGETTGYGIASDVQARVVEIVSNQSFDRFLEERLFRPLGMNDTGFWLKPDRKRRLVSVHWTKEGNIVPMGKVHGFPKPTIILVEPWAVEGYSKPKIRTGGASGLLSTAEDFWRFAQMMANGGVFRGKRILSPSTVHYMTQDHTSFLFDTRAPENVHGQSWGLGFRVMNNPARAEMMSSEGTFFGHGAAATTFWVDPAKELVVVALTQHMSSEKSDLGTLAPEIRALVYGAIVN